MIKLPLRPGFKPPEPSTLEPSTEGFTPDIPPAPARSSIVLPRRGGGTAIIPRKTLTAAAFAGPALNRFAAPGDGAPPGIRLTQLPEAQKTGITLSIDELLQKHPLPPTPMGDKFTLDGWQVEDICTLAQWSRVGAFLPVGAGKTVIATLVCLAWADDIRVVIVPPILVKQWTLWLNSIPGCGPALMYKGSPSQRKSMDLKIHRWWVMSYEIFKRDFDRLQATARGKTLALVVDEAQNIKNTETKLWKKCNEFSLGQKLCLMTGTELNSPADAYGYVRIKTPGVYRSYGQFKNVHVKEEDFFHTPISWKNLDLMNQNLYLQSVQRTKEEVHASVPRANYIPLPYDLDPVHLKLYNELAEQQLLLLEDGGKIDATSTNALYLYTQQIIIDWARFSGDPTVRPAVLDVLDMLIDSTGFGVGNGPTKFIVWTWFKHSTVIVSDYLKSLYPGRVVLAYSDANSQKSVDTFMENPECWWLVAQPLSAGAGLNPQYICYNSVFVEFPTRTILFRQSAGRVDRKGQRFNANIWIAQATGTIQETMYKNLLNNDELVQTVQGSTRDLRRIIHGT